MMPANHHEIDQVPLPRRLHLELTNRCNSRCTSCLRTFAPTAERDLSPPEIERTLAGLPGLEEVALHVNGEPLLSPHLETAVKLARRHGATAELNTNALALGEERGRSLVAAGLSRLNVSLDSATRQTYLRLRGVDAFERVLANVRAFITARGPRPATPRVSVWATVSRCNVEELPALADLCGDLGVDELYLQRLVTFGAGTATAAESLHGRVGAREAALLAETMHRASRHGVAIGTCGGRKPTDMLERTGRPEPWRACLRPWTSAVVMADGAVAPCCIATFVASPGAYELGNVLSSGWAPIWNGAPYLRLRAGLTSGDAPAFCRHCGEAWSL